MHATPRMAALQRRVALVEAHAHRAQLRHGLRRLAHEHVDRGGVAEPGARGDRVGGVLLGGVVVGSDRGNATLCPGRRRQLRRAGGDHRDGAAVGRVQRAPQARGARADHDGACAHSLNTGPAGTVRPAVGPIAIMRSTAARARSAMSGGTSISKTPSRSEREQVLRRDHLHVLALGLAVDRHELLVRVALVAAGAGSPSRSRPGTGDVATPPPRSPSLRSRAPSCGRRGVRPPRGATSRWSCSRTPDGRGARRRARPRAWPSRSPGWIPACTWHSPIQMCIFRPVCRSTCAPRN